MTRFTFDHSTSPSPLNDSSLNYRLAPGPNRYHVNPLHHALLDKQALHSQPDRERNLSARINVSLQTRRPLSLQPCQSTTATYRYPQILLSSLSTQMSIRTEPQSIIET